MTIAPLAVVQARLGSTRLPGKMLLPLGGKPLICWALDAAVEAFGTFNTVVAIPASTENDALADALQEESPHVAIFRWDGDERDVLGRFHACAHTYRWHPESVLVRVTPDDPFKDPRLMRRVANGERLPVEIGAEAFTLAMLDAAHAREDAPERREHITRALFPVEVERLTRPGWTVDTLQDYEAARRRVDDA